MAIYDDKFIPGLSELSQAIKKHGARAAIQLHHAGRYSKSGITGQQIVAPSSISLPGMEVPQELTLSDIKNLIDSFAKAAGRVKKAGFEGIELHSAHHYLFAQFLSPVSNNRRDAYGGSLRNRARFLLEVLEAIKGAVGASFPIWCRLNGEENDVEGGLTIEDTREIAIMAEQVGADAVHVSAIPPIRSLFSPMGWGLHLSRAVKRGVKIPVIAVGKLNPELAEKALEEGMADLISLGRPLIADPELPNKIMSGKTEDIRPCLYCSICEHERRDDNGIQCAVNFAAGREKDCALVPPCQARKLIVVGGGPAGMEAARVASLRGCEVELYEKKDRLGGQLNPASVAPHKEDVGRLTKYLAKQMENLSVKVNLGQEATPESVIDSKPDAVIIATGITLHKLDVPGSDETRVVSFEDVLDGTAEVGACVIVVGGGLIGCETSLYLAGRGRKVTIVEVLDDIAT